MNVPSQIREYPLEKNPNINKRTGSPCFSRIFWGKEKPCEAKSASNEELFSTETPKRGKNFSKVHFLACFLAKNAKFLQYKCIFWQHTGRIAILSVRKLVS